MTTTQIDDNNIPFAEWDIFPVKAYECALKEVKEQFNDLLSEVESTTAKLYKLLTIFVSFISATASIIASQDYNKCVVVIFALLSVYNICGILWLLRSRESFSRGLRIESMTNTEFDRFDYNQADKIKLLFVNCIEQYSGKINSLRGMVVERNYYYNVYLATTILIAIGLSVYLGLLFNFTK